MCVTCGYIYVWEESTCVQEYMWLCVEGRDQLCVSFLRLGTTHFVFKQSLHLAWNSPSKHGWLDSEPWGSYLSPPP